MTGQDGEAARKVRATLSRKVTVEPPKVREIAAECAELDHNDRDNGRRLVAWFGDELHYVSGLGWLLWQGTHWQRDEADLRVRFLAQEIVDKIKLEAEQLTPSEAQQKLLRRAAEANAKPAEQLTPSDLQAIARAAEIEKAVATKRGKRLAWAVTSGNAAKTTAMLAQAQSLKTLAIDRLDADHMQFNVRNGTLRFWRELDPERPEGSTRMAGNFSFAPHARGDLITKLAEVDYDPEASCPFFIEQFLDKLQPKADMRLLLQVATAYGLLLGGNDEQRLVYHYGTGANGKSAFFELIGRLAGSYRQIAAPETVAGDSQRTGQQANPDIARLHNARLVTIEELPKNLPLREELIKAMTGGTKILARFLNKDFFEFLPIFTPMLNGNNRPSIVGADYGIWRRLLLILWGVTIPPAERMPANELAARLDAERSGILNWLIDGLMVYMRSGLEPLIPEEVRNFTEDFRQERDNVGVFAEVAIETAAGETLQAGTLYKAYLAWCENNAQRPASQRSFGDRLSEKGLRKRRGNYVVYLDVRLKPGAMAADGARPPPFRDPDDPGFDPARP